MLTHIPKFRVQTGDSHDWTTRLILVLTRPRAMSVPSVSVRGLMIIIAITAMLIGIIALALRRERLLEVASFHEVNERASRAAAASDREVLNRLAKRRSGGILGGKYGAMKIEGGERGALDAVRIYTAQERRRRSEAEYHQAMKRKYRYAADRPWVSVPPNAPEPQ